MSSPALQKTRLSDGDLSAGCSLERALGNELGGKQEGEELTLKPQEGLSGLPHGRPRQGGCIALGEGALLPRGRSWDETFLGPPSKQHSQQLQDECLSPRGASAQCPKAATGEVVHRTEPKRSSAAGPEKGRGSAALGKQGGRSPGRGFLES